MTAPTAATVRTAACESLAYLTSGRRQSVFHQGSDLDALRRLIPDTNHHVVTGGVIPDEMAGLVREVIGAVPGTEKWDQIRNSAPFARAQLRRWAARNDHTITFISTTD